VSVHVCSGLDADERMLGGVQGLDAWSTRDVQWWLCSQVDKEPLINREPMQRAVAVVVVNLWLDGDALAAIDPGVFKTALIRVMQSELPLDPADSDKKKDGQADAVDLLVSGLLDAVEKLQAQHRDFLHHLVPAHVATVDDVAATKGWLPRQVQ
jgi:hypothetical protein